MKWDDGITVLIPTRDRALMLEAVLPSYLQEGVTRLLILDDASSDSTGELSVRLSAADNRVEYWPATKRLGLPLNRNRGLDETRTRFVFFGEDDVELPGNYLHHLVSLIEEQRAAIAGTPMSVVPFARSADPMRWLGGRAPLPSLGFGHERHVELRRGVYRVQHVHSVCLLDMSLTKELRYSPDYGGNAFREESDFQLRAGARGPIVADVQRHFIHYSRPTALARTGCSESRWFRYELDAARNNWRFIVRNENELRRTGILCRSKEIAQVEFLASRVAARSMISMRRLKRRLLEGRR